jgi:hypothetical protein
MTERSNQKTTIKQRIESMYNRKLVTLTCLVAVLTLASFTAQAQLGGLGKKKAAAGSGVDVTAQQDKLVKEYSAGGALLSEAVALTIEALSSKEIADKYRAEAKDVIGGTSKDPKHVHKVLEGGIKQADELIAKAGELSAEQKKLVQKSLVPFGGGMAVDAALVLLAVETAKQAQDEVKSNPMAATKFAPSIYLASVLPGDVKTGGQTLGNYMKLAKKNGIEVPADVSKALAGPE